MLFRDGSYEISEAEGVQRGTKIILHLKPDCSEFSKEETIKSTDNIFFFWFTLELKFFKILYSYLCLTQNVNLWLPMGNSSYIIYSIPMGNNNYSITYHKHNFLLDLNLLIGTQISLVNPWIDLPVDETLIIV